MNRGISYQLPCAWEHAISGWMGYLSAAGQSEETRRARRGVIRRLAHQSGTAGPADLDPQWLVEFCGTQQWSLDYRRCVRTSTDRFYQWAIAAKLALINPALALPRTPESRPRPRPVNDEVWEALLARAAPRERLMARLACEAGLRRAEVARVHRTDVIEDADGWSLIVTGKGNKQRTVPLTTSLADELRSYSPGYSPMGFLFPGQIDGHLGPNMVGKLISGLMPKGVSMHKLRHRYASKGYAGTGDLVAVQAALGHASLATTQRYVATTDARIRAVSESAGR